MVGEVEGVEVRSDAAVAVDAAVVVHEVRVDLEGDGERAARHQGQPHQRLVAPTHTTTGTDRH